MDPKPRVELTHGCREPIQIVAGAAYETVEVPRFTAGPVGTCGEATDHEVLHAMAVQRRDQSLGAELPQLGERRPDGAFARSSSVELREKRQNLLAAVKTAAVPCNRHVVRGRRWRVSYCVRQLLERADRSGVGHDSHGISDPRASSTTVRSN